MSRIFLYLLSGLLFSLLFFNHATTRYALDDSLVKEDSNKSTNTSVDYFNNFSCEGDDNYYKQFFPACWLIDGPFENVGRETFLMPVKWSQEGFPYLTQGGDLILTASNRNGTERHPDVVVGKIISVYLLQYLLCRREIPMGKLVEDINVRHLSTTKAGGFAGTTDRPVHCQVTIRNRTNSSIDKMRI